MGINVDLIKRRDALIAQIKAKDEQIKEVKNEQIKEVKNEKEAEKSSAKASGSIFGSMTKPQVSIGDKTNVVDNTTEIMTRHEKEKERIEKELEQIDKTIKEENEKLEKPARREILA